jgi:hypothetical protein
MKLSIAPLLLASLLIACSGGDAPRQAQTPSAAAPSDAIAKDLPMDPRARIGFSARGALKRNSDHPALLQARTGPPR